ncbi:MAG: hypothetical protein K2L98_03810 [Bacilli bacterium]|nr:hypothetical protein [Bacilli bacterium]
MNDDKTRAREFVSRVRYLAAEYNLPFFIVTDGASATSNNGCEAVRVARENHIKYELSINADPYEDWSKDNFISFPVDELKDLKKRLDDKKEIYTTRVSSEVGKYKLNEEYDSPLGKLKVISLEHFENIDDHPFIDELNEKQKNEINEYIKETGYDLVCLTKV